MIRTSRPLLAAALAFATLTGCQKVKSVELTPGRISLTQEGQELRLKATAVDGSGSEVPNVPFEFRSSDPQVASVSNDGVVKGFHSGDAVITATAKEKSAQSTVEVRIPFAMSLVPDSITLHGVGETGTLTAKVLDDKGREVPGSVVTWENQSPQIVSVDKGNVTALGVGDAVLFAVAGKLRAPAHVLVTPPRVEAVELTPATVTLKVGGHARLEAVARDAKKQPAPGVSFQWESSDPKIVAVDPTGALTGMKRGEASVTVRAGDKSVASRVTVR